MQHPATEPADPPAETPEQEHERLMAKALKTRRPGATRPSRRYLSKARRNGVNVSPEQVVAGARGGLSLEPTLTRPAEPRGRPRERRARATRRAGGSADDDGGGSELPPPLAPALPPRALYTFGCLSPEQRGEVAR